MSAKPNIQAIVLLLMLTTGGSAEGMNVQKDTFIVIRKNFKSTYDRTPSCQWYLCNDTLVFHNKEEFNIAKDSFARSRIEKFPYCKFYDNKGRIIEEGYWDGEVFKGTYCNYYKNGAVKAKGRFEDNTPTGLWTFYKKDGTVKKQITVI